MRYIAYLLPLTYANNAMRAIMIKGQGLNAISTDLIILSFLHSLLSLQVLAFSGGKQNEENDSILFSISYTDHYGLERSSSL